MLAQGKLLTTNFCIIASRYHRWGAAKRALNLSSLMTLQNSLLICSEPCNWRARRLNRQKTRECAVCSVGGLNAFAWRSLQVDLGSSYQCWRKDCWRTKERKQPYQHSPVPGDVQLLIVNVGFFSFGPVDSAFGFFDFLRTTLSY